MKKLFLIFLISISTSFFITINAQEPLFNIVQVKPPQHIQDAYQSWITTNDFWLVLVESGLYVPTGEFWKVSAKGSMGYNHLNGAYIVPVTLPNWPGYISAIVIFNDGSVDFIHLWGYSSWFTYVKTAQ